MQQFGDNRSTFKQRNRVAFSTPNSSPWRKSSIQSIRQLSMSAESGRLHETLVRVRHFWLQIYAVVWHQGTVNLFRHNNTLHPATNNPDVALLQTAATS